MEFFNQLSPGWQLTIVATIKVVCVMAVLLPMIAYSVMAERRVSALIQDRVGPNRVGPFGLLQPLADGLKSLLKEDFTPGHVHKLYFTLAPAIAMIPAFLTFAVIPFGSTMGSERMVIADLNVGVLYIFGIVSLSVYGIVLAGYASNSKYPFLGGIRSSAQMISYEIAMGMAVIPVFMFVGSLNLSSIIEYQSGSLLNWLVFKSPMTLLSFCIFFVAVFAETNRHPFDMPECETELVAGYHSEYGSMRFALFFLGEYAAMIAGSALLVTVFFGGWTLPFFGLDTPAQTLLGGILHIGIFLAKVGFFMIVMIWVRWMLPRFRYDQLMSLGWKRFLPLALVNILVTAVWLFATTEKSLP
jgi:NADH-quinone oxidoreductase subunit H